MRGRQKVMRLIIKDFQANTVWTSKAASLQCRLQTVATNFYLPYMHVPLQRNVEVLLVKRWIFFFATLYLNLTMWLALAYGMLVNVTQAKAWKRIRAHSACLKIWEHHANKAKVASRNWETIHTWHETFDLRIRYACQSPVMWLRPPEIIQQPTKLSADHR